MPLSPAFRRDFDQAKEPEAISQILDQYPAICDAVYQDLNPFGDDVSDTGACGMSAEQVLRAAVAKALFGYSYRGLAFHIADSRCLRTFCMIGIGESFKKSTLQSNISALSGKTWERINRIIIGHAKEEEIEKGREVRIDCTVVETAAASCRMGRTAAP